MARKKKVETKKEETSTISIETAPVGDLSSFIQIDTAPSVDLNVAMKSNTKVQGFLQTIYNLGYQDGKINAKQKVFRINAQTGKLEYFG